MRRHLCAVFLSFVAGLALCRPVAAQSTYGSLTGTVSDPSGAVIVDARVHVVEERTRASRSAATNSAGDYLVVNLDPGFYTVSVEAPGFKKLVRENIELLARQTVRVDAKLGLAETTEEVQVSASAGVIVTETPAISDSKTGREINELSLNFRATDNTSPLVVATLAPGVQKDSDNQISISGGMPFAASVSIDGISTLNARFNGPVEELFPSVEGIAEFKVSSTNNNAEFAQTSDITVTSKSGTNDLHGTLFWFHQNRALNATDPFAPADPGVPNKRLKPALVANSFGGAVEGPITVPRLYSGKDRSFFFFDYEGVRRPSATTLRQVVPPDAWRSGDLSSVSTPIVDPFTGVPFPNNKILINPTSAKALELLFPRQNQPTGASIDAPNYIINVPGGFRADSIDLRVDHKFTERQDAFVRYTLKNLNRTGVNGSDYSTPAGAYSRPIEVRNLAGSYNWLIRPTLIDEFRAGLSLAHFDNTYPLAAQGRDIIRQLGLTGLPENPPQGGLPYFGFNDGSITVSSSPGLTNPVYSETLVIGNNLTWIRGNHAFKAGFEVQRLEFKDISSYNVGDDYGEYYFESGAAGVDSYSGNAFADFLLGLPRQTAKALNGPDFNPYAWRSSFFVQDDWRVSPRLTVNLGLRYELHPPFDDKTNQLANFDPDFPGGRVIVQDLNLVAPLFRQSIGSTPIVTYQEAGLPRVLRFTDKNNFNPRVGLAWRPFGDNRTVIRSGFGLYTVSILGRVLYSLEGVASGSFLSFTNTAPSEVSNTGRVALRFPNVFPSGSGDLPGLPDYRRANPFHFEDPYSMQWSFTIERDLGRATGLRLTYNGQRTINLVHSPDLNQARPNTLGYEAVKDTRPFPNFNAVLTRANGTTAKYHAFTTEVNRHFGDGLAFQSSWVWAKNLSNAGGVAPTAFAAENGPTTLDIFGIQNDYGDVAFTRRHRFLTTFLWELPYGKGRRWGRNIGRTVEAVAAGWQVSGIVALQTGPFLTPFFRGTDPSGTGANVRGVQTTQRPDRVGNGNLDDPVAERWFDRTAFVVPPNKIGRFGNAGVGILLGPGTQVFSMSLAKRISLTEQLALRGEATFANLFNHTNLDVPSTMNIGSSNFGRITATQKADLGGPRTVQVSLRLLF